MIFQWLFKEVFWGSKTLFLEGNFKSVLGVFLGGGTTVFLEGVF